jgi:signal transduction histidine kinase
VAHGERRGVLTLAMAGSARPFAPAELPTMVEFARRAALAVDNAAHFRDSQQAARARERILAIVSHDLRNPLGTIRMTAQALIEAPSIAEERRRQQLTRIQGATDRMERLIEDLLDMARIDAGKGLSLRPEVHEVAPLVEEVGEVAAPRAAAKGIALRWAVAADLRPLWCDRQRIFQVLGNLISNALKFTPEGGEVELRAEPAGGGVVFVVADTGTGMDEKDVGRIFDPYWQASRTASLGTGLGLPIVKGIVQAHGGRIRVESRPGRGTTISFTLPLRPSRGPGG